VLPRNATGYVRNALRGGVQVVVMLGSAVRGTVLITSPGMSRAKSAATSQKGARSCGAYDEIRALSPRERAAVRECSGARRRFIIRGSTGVMPG
jgi:hypothetical protein